MPRTHFSVGSFAEMRSAKKLTLLYPIISLQQDYAVKFWSDKEYAIHLSKLLSEQEWMQFKGDILQIYAEQNAKRVALRKLVELNCYRSLHRMYIIILNQFLLAIPRCCHRDPRRDKTLLQKFLLCPIELISIPILYVLMAFILAFLLLDLLSLPRFFLFHRHQIAFLESVVVAHPELDPAVVEEELVQKVQNLLDSLCRHHPGVHCNLCASVVHQPRQGSNASYDVDVFEIQFHKFAQETKP